MKKNKVEFVVAKRRNYHDGRYWAEWRIDRVESGPSLTSRMPVADVFGARRHALWVAEAMNRQSRRKQLKVRSALAERGLR